MTRDDIIRMAKEAGICTGNSILLPAPDGQIEALDRFADLVAAAEREACAELCEEMEDRENPYERNVAVLDCAAAIRARGEA